MQVQNTGNVVLKLQAGSANTAYLGFGTDSDALANHISVFNNSGSPSMGFNVNNARRMTIDSTGNVGIGTASPTETFQVNTAVNTLSGLVVTNNATGVVASTDGLFIGVGGTASPDARITFRENANLRLGANNTDVMTIASSGNVGIGTTTPNSQLHLYAAAAANVMTLETAVGNGNDSTLVFNKSRSGGVITSADDLGEIRFNGHDGTSFVTGAYISGDSSGTISTGDLNGILRFGTDGSERLRIDSTGNVGIGTASPNHLLEVYGNGGIALVDPTNNLNEGQKIAFFAAGRSDVDEEFASIKGLLTSNQGGSGNVQWGHLQFNTSGNERLRITSSGKVGIGTTSPNSILNLVGADPILLIKDTDMGQTSANSRIRIAESGAGGVTDNNWDIGAGISGTSLFDLGFNYNNAQLVTFKITGNVGIGTTSPQTKLTVDAANVFQLRLANTGTGGGYWNIGQTTTGMAIGSKGLAFVPDSSSSANATVVFLNNGNVGIGTTTPGAKLEVASVEDTEHIRLTDTTNNDSSGLYTGNGSPEGTVTAQLGSLYTDNANGNLYRKASGDDTNTGWKALISKDEAGMVLLGTQVISSSQYTVDLDNLMDGTYDTYVLVVDSMSSTANDDYVLIRVGTGATPTYSSSAFYSYSLVGDVAGTAFGENSNNNTSFFVTEFNATTARVDAASETSYTMYITGAADSGASYTRLNGTVTYRAGSVGTFTGSFGGSWDSTTNVTSVRTSFALGAVDRGVFKLYGLQKTVGADVAEIYYSDDVQVPGSLVAIDNKKAGWVTAANTTSSSSAVGVVSTEPGVTLEGSDVDTNGAQTRVALSGRVLTRVNSDGGSIRAGDRITASAVPGVGRKAKWYEPSIAIALEPHSGSNEERIMTFIDPQQGIGMNDFVFQPVDKDAEETLFDRMISLAQNFVNGVLEVVGLRTRELCVFDDSGETCLNRTQLNAVLNQSNVISSPSKPKPTPNAQPSPEPTPEPTPTPTQPKPEPTPTPTPANPEIPEPEPEVIEEEVPLEEVVPAEVNPAPESEQTSDPESLPAV